MTIEPTESIPKSIIHADRVLHELNKRISVGSYLNPTNTGAARLAFVAGAKAPPFEYATASWVDSEIELLQTLKVDKGHPFGEMLAASVRSTAHMYLALRDRTPEAFGRLAESSGWIPSEEVVQAASLEVPMKDEAPFVFGAQGMKLELEKALALRGYVSWVVEINHVMAARVSVDSAKYLIKVNAAAKFRERDVAKLVAHEIDVHVTRGKNGEGQPLHIFSTGLPNSLETEEGLAIYSEELARASTPGGRWRRGLVCRAILWAQEMGFRDLFDRIVEVAGPAMAWGISVRLKRGIADPSLPGVYAKDVVYYRGEIRVAKWLQSGGSLSTLYVGKVGLEHPVEQWLSEGLLGSREVPELFLQDLGL
jgi:hypothetical protein